MNNQKGFTHLVLIIIFVLLAIAAVVFLKVGGFEVKQYQFSSPNPTTAWETYENSEVGFSFKHPASWTKKEIGDEYFDYYGTEGSVSVSWGKGLSGADGGWCDPNNKFGVVITPYSVNDNDLKGCISTKGSQSYIVSKQLNDDIVILIMAGDSDFATNYQEETIRQVLSSFEFTDTQDSIATLDCSGGVYTDDTVDFSINCPENFQAYVFKEKPTYDNLTEKAICLSADTKPDFDAASRCTGGIIIWANGDGWGGGCDEELRAQIEIDGEEITYCLLDSGFGMVFLGGQYVEGSGVNRFLITGNFTNTFTKDEALEILETFQKTE